MSTPLPVIAEIPPVDTVRTFCARIEHARICYFNGNAEPFDQLSVGLDLSKIFMKSAFRVLEENHERVRIEPREVIENICNGVVGVVSLIKRAYQGSNIKAGGELFSLVVSTGLLGRNLKAAGIVVDCVMTAHDIYFFDIVISLPQAYHILSLNPVACSQVQVMNGHSVIINAIQAIDVGQHPDLLASQGKREKLIALANQARAVIFEDRGW